MPRTFSAVSGDTRARLLWITLETVITLTPASAAISFRVIKSVSPAFIVLLIITNRDGVVNEEVISAFYSIVALQIDAIILF